MAHSRHSRTMKLLVPLVLALIPVAVAAWALHLASPTTSESQFPGTEVASAREHLEPDGAVAFVENRGQWSGDVRFVADAASMQVALEPTGLRLRASDGRELGLAFADAETTRIAGEDRREEVRHYLIGSDARNYRRDVPTWSSVRYEDVRPGIDVRVRDSEGSIEYDILVDAGVDPSGFHIRSSVSGLSVDEDGSLRIPAERGDLVQPAPRTFEETETGDLRELPSRFVCVDDSTYGFEVDGRDPSRKLVIDPALVWSTFLGGRGEEVATKVVVLDDGSYAVHGVTSSTSFPNEGTTTDSGNIYIARYAPDGQTLLSTAILGGSGPEAAASMAKIPDGSGDLVIGGYTWSEDFPVTPGAFDTVKGSPSRASRWTAARSSSRRSSASPHRISSSRSAPRRTAR